MGRPAPALADWLILTSAPGIGPRTVARLLERFGDPGAVVRAAPRWLADAGLAPAAVTALKAPDRAAIERILAWSEQPDAHLLALTDVRYPARLAELPDAPPLLFLRGDPDLLSEPQVAVVGTRSPTASGIEITREFARRLAADGLLVTSGLAVGIDGAAHLGALETGRTLAVLGTGPDLVYPAAHLELARRIAERGALVSELRPGQGPAARNFPRRNRIISGLSLGVLVTEAALESGSLITARCALEQGREVFAVPGSIRNPRARGCHALIRDGAKLVEDPDEILAELAPLLRGYLSEAGRAATGSSAGGSNARSAPGVAGLDPDYRALLDAMGFDPVAPDQLIARCGRSAREVSSMLLVLELEGHVSSDAGGRYRRVGA